MSDTSPVESSISPGRVAAPAAPARAGTTTRGERVEAAANVIADAADADVLLLNSPMLAPVDLQLIEMCTSRSRRTNVIFMLITHGGQAEPAYRIARWLQEHYERFTFFVTGPCKSAGTLAALGAHEIIISDYGELGPLDVQMSMEDEPAPTRSGLTALSAFTTLQAHASAAFNRFLEETKERNRFITTKTAIGVATDLASRLFAPIYAHIDAMHIGDAGRSLGIAYRYGEILSAESKNCSSRSLFKLTYGYPSHDFIIDGHQAETLFHRVRRPSQIERQLADELDSDAREPCSPGQTLLTFLNSQPTDSSREGTDDQEQGDPGQRVATEPADGGGGPGAVASGAGPASGA